MNRLGRSLLLSCYCCFGFICQNRGLSISGNGLGVHSMHSSARRRDLVGSEHNGRIAAAFTGTAADGSRCSRDRLVEILGFVDHIWVLILGDGHRRLDNVLRHGCDSRLRRIDVPGSWLLHDLVLRHDLRGGLSRVYVLRDRLFDDLVLGHDLGRVCCVDVLGYGLGDMLRHKLGRRLNMLHDFRDSHRFSNLDGLAS